MRLLICAGGTGGGVYPAFVVLQALSGKTETAVLWVGGQGGMEAGLVERMKIPFQAIPAAGVHGVGLRSLPGNSARLARGFFASRKILKTFKPDVLLFTGGYVAVPMAAAARAPGLGFARPRSLVYIPDIEPGLAHKAVLQFADRAALTVEDTRKYLPARVPAEVTGYPVRPEFLGWERARARESLQLREDLPVLLVTGGSRGARSINTAVTEALPELLKEMQIVHVTGELDWEQVDNRRSGLPEHLGSRYRAYPYLHEEMGAALAAADLVVSRAGASVLGEYPLFGLPAVLVPYPYAWRYQQVNAGYLVDRKAAVLLRDEDLASQLQSLVLSLVRDPERLAEMRRCMSGLRRPAASQNLAELLVSLAGRPGKPKE